MSDDNTTGDEATEFPLKYLSSDAARREVMNTLATLELDIYKLGIQSTMLGSGVEHKLQNGLTIEQAVAAIRGRIDRVEKAYSHLLNDPTQQ